MKKLSYVMFAAAFVLSYITVGATCFDYAAMLCAIAHRGSSFPANVVFFTTLIPYGTVTLIFAGLGILFFRKGKKNV